MQWHPPHGHGPGHLLRADVVQHAPGGAGSTGRRRIISILAGHLGRRCQAGPAHHRTRHALRRGDRAGRCDLNKVFVATGGASGLGEGTARMLAQEGAKVVIADLQADKGQAVVAAAVALGPLFGLVNCAGIAPAV